MNSEEQTGKLPQKVTVVTRKETVTKEAAREIMIIDEKEATPMNTEVTKTAIAKAALQKETATAQKWTEVEIECHSRTRDTWKEITVEIRTLGTRIRIVGTTGVILNRTDTTTDISLTKTHHQDVTENFTETNLGRVTGTTTSFKTTDETILQIM